MSERVARIRIGLDGIEPEIWWRVEVPLDLNLRGLHDAIQAVMAWQDYHLFEFRSATSSMACRDPEWDDGRKIFKAWLAKLETFVERGIDTFGYVYTIWAIAGTLAIEAVNAVHSKHTYPRYVDGARRASP
jgi:hypothetical protein